MNHGQVWNSIMDESVTVAFIERFQKYDHTSFGKHTIIRLTGKLSYPELVIEIVSWII